MFMITCDLCQIYRRVGVILERIHAIEDKLNGRCK